jgi:cytochrome b6-f complex iron-sulfur subunit
MDRKKFIKTCGYAYLGGSVLIPLLPGCSSAAYFAQTAVEPNRIVIRRSEFLKTVKEKTITRTFILVKSEKFSYPICVYRIHDREFSALLLQCTHKGCELKPQGNFLVCPCHGSEFTHTGVVQNPPAEQDLLTFKTSTDNENIYLYL